MKNGRHLERQRFRCKDCGFQFTRDTPRGRPATEKAMAILLYTLGLSFNATSVNGTGRPSIADMIAVGVKNKMKESRCREIFEEVKGNCGELLLADIH